MRVDRRRFLSASLAFAGASALRADEDFVDRWSMFRAFAGTWSGEQTGVWGEGRGIRTYRFFIDDSFLEQRTMLRFDPQPANLEGETRLDYGVVSFDRRDNAYFLRRYYPGGVFVEYRLVESDALAGRFVWLSDRVENGTPATAIRYSVQRDNDEEFRESVALEPEGEAPSTVIEGRWRRSR